MTRQLLCQSCQIVFFHNPCVLYVVRMNFSLPGNLWLDTWITFLCYIILEICQFVIPAEKRQLEGRGNFPSPLFLSAPSQSWLLKIDDCKHLRAPWGRFWPNMYALLLQWASYQIRKIAGCACAGGTRNVSSITAGWRSQHALRYVRHACAVMPGLLTGGFLWSRWWGKRSRHSQRICNPQFRVSGKRHIGWLVVFQIFLLVWNIQCFGLNFSRNRSVLDIFCLYGRYNPLK